MILGILSDTHNNLPNLQAALKIFQQEGVTHLIHCGDLTAPDTASLLEGFRVILTFGNGDFASGEILAALKSLDPENYAGMVYTGEIDGVMLAVVHGHERERLDALIDSGRYAYVFRGHSHLHQDTMRGSTRVINPGSLGGLHREPRQVCLLDLQTGEARFIPVE
jgi:uncharacterized protein